ncbi:MAG TPA: cyanophycin synthetase [Streptosporangiaceae bacterium]|nr:cyanophycin synthetase [Streptosporangiaceae bacterium]
MRLEHMRHLGGPNIFGTKPVSLARIELDELTCKETTDLPGFAERLLELLPGLREHHCAAGRPGGFIDAMSHGTYFGHVAEHVALELSGLAGRDVHLGRTMWAGADGRYDLMMECPADEPEDSAIPSELCALAITVIEELLAERSPDLTADLEAIGRSAERERLGPSTTAIAEAARRRGIPVRRVGGLSMLRLGYGCHRRLVSAAMTEQTSAIGVDIASDKMLAKKLMARAGIAVPDGVVAKTEVEAIRAADAIHGTVVVKPRNGNHGRCITVGVQTPAEARQAYRRAAAGSGSCEVIVETYVPGKDYRVLVVDGRVAAAAELRPPWVTGDGEHTVIELIDMVNADPRRGHGHSRPLTKITVDDAMLAHIAAAGFQPGTVPTNGQQITLRRNGNLSTGGTSKDVTDQVHPDVAELCRRAAAVTGLDICGIDLRLEDIAAPLFAPGLAGTSRHGGNRQAAAVIEINACPGLRMHLTPADGMGRAVAEAIVDRLYPPGAISRIPIVSVTGTNGKTTTVRMIAHVLRQAGLRTGMSCTDGVFIGGRCVLEADASGPLSAEMVLDDTTVEAAVLETARGGILRRGLGYDKADVAVITNISADHLGEDGIDNQKDLISVKSLVAEEVRRGGNVVLNATDHATAAIADRPAVRRNEPVLRYFSVTPGNALIERHKRSGGICYEASDGQLIETAGGLQRLIMNIADLPGAFGGRAQHVVANALAAIAACRAAGVTVKDIREALSTFTPGAVNPGRGNVYAVTAGPAASTAAGPVLVDYGHNAAALQATGQMVASVWEGEPVAAITLPGDRRDDLITESAEAIASWFGTVVIYEDQDRRGRAPGEMRELIATAMRKIRPEVHVTFADGPGEALRAAVELAAGGPVLFLYEKLDPALEALESLGATPWPEEDLMGDLEGAAPPDDLPSDLIISGNHVQAATTNTPIGPA